MASGVQLLANNASIQSFLAFLNKSPTPYHAVASCESMLINAGFEQLHERDHFPSLKQLGKYYIKKNQSSVFAFAVGGAYKPGNGGFSAVVAHTDSPCLRMKPISKKSTEKYLQVGVSTYGGGIWRTWFDRDLSVAGQVIYQREKTIFHKLIDLRRPIMHVPNLAIHLDRSGNEKFEFSKENHLRPLFGLASAAKKDNQTKMAEDEEKKVLTDELQKNCCITDDHHYLLLTEVANAANCCADEIIDLDLYLYDVQPAVLSGLRQEFISGARLDNLVGTYTAVQGLIESVSTPSGLAAFESDPNIRLIGCYDHEEVGSESSKGAASAFTEWLLRRLASCSDDPLAFEYAVGKSLIISSDQAHAVHPNYSEKHDGGHKPVFGGGVVVKINANQRYATSAFTHAVLKVIADAANVPLQKFVVHNDSSCGSTIGPILATKLGIQTIDVGCVQLAMHSIRELGDPASIPQATSLFAKFFECLPAVLSSVKEAE